MTFLAIATGDTAHPAYLMSAFKPILFLLVVSAWGWALAFISADAVRYGLAMRRTWELIHLGIWVVAIVIGLMIPFFWLGLPAMLVLCAMAFSGYTIFRNTKVPAAVQWRLSMDSWRQKMNARDQARAQKQAVVRMMKADGELKEVPTGDDLHVAAHGVLEQLLGFALPRQAERIDVVAESHKASVAVRVDGVSYPLPEVDPKTAITLIGYMREHAGMDLSERRRRQRGTTKIHAGDYGEHELTVIYSGTTRGLSLVVEIDRQQLSLMRPENLGFLDSQYAQLSVVLDDLKHVVLVACPSHQGLTSTLGSLVSHHDPYTQSVVTLEDEIEVDLEGVSQEEIEPGTDAETVERRLAAILRAEPAVVMLSRLTDPSQARLVAENAGDTKFYLGLRADETFGALKVWLKAVGDTKQAASALGAIVSQRLVRRICQTCRVAYRPDTSILKKLNLPSDRVPQLFKHSGKVMVSKDRTRPCPECHGIGYRGRIGVFEVMVLDDEARGVLATGQLNQFRAHLRRRKMVYLQEVALLKAVEGMTSVSEVNRSLATDKR